MISTRLQKGSAHIIIIVVLILALIGALGWIFWQNFSKANDTNQRKNDKQSSVKNEPTKEKLVTGRSELADSISPVTFEYPESWSLSRKSDGPIPPNSDGFSSEAITLRYQNSTLTVNYSLGNGGIGGMCLPEEQGKVVSLSYEGLPNAKGVSYVTYVHNDLDGTRHSYAGLMRTGGDGLKSLSDIKAGDSSCDLSFRGILTISDGDVTLNVMGPSVHIDGTNEDSDVSDKYSGKVYEQAKAILLSTKLTLSNP